MNFRNSHWILFAAAYLLAGHTRAEYSYWQGTTGGDLSDETQWGATGLTLDRNYFQNAQSAPFTLSKDYAGLYWPFFNKNASFTLGLADYTLMPQYRMHFEGGVSGSSQARFTIMNGTVAMKSDADRIFIGDQTPWNFVYVDAGGVLRTSTGSYLSLGPNKTYNSLIVQNGGKLQGPVQVGLTSGGGNAIAVTGEGSSWTCEDTRTSVLGVKAGNNMLTVTNGGIVALGGDLRSGAWNAGAGDGNRIVVSCGGKLTSGSNILIGQYSCNNRLEVFNGGTVIATNNLSVGTQVNSSDSSRTALTGNEVLVTGEDALLQTVGHIVVADGDKVVGSRLLVEKGGRVQVGNELRVAYNSTGVSNNVEVAAGGTLDVAGETSVGYKGPCNLMHVASGGVFRATSPATFYMGRNSSAPLNEMRVEGTVLANWPNATSVSWWYVGANSASNTLRVANGGLCALTNACFSVGDAVGAKGNYVEVGPGGRVELACPSSSDERFYLGTYGSGNTLCVTGGVVTAPLCLVGMGAKLSGSGNLLKILDGGVLDVRRIVVGDVAPSNTMAVANGTVRIAETLDVGYSSVSDTASPLGCGVVIEGSNTTITAQSTMRLHNDAHLTFRIPENGFADVPVRCLNVEAAVAAGITVEFADEHCKNHRVVLVETAEDISTTAIDRLAQNWTLPEGVKVDLSNKSQIAVRIPPKGTMAVIL